MPHIIKFDPKEYEAAFLFNYFINSCKEQEEYLRENQKDYLGDYPNYTLDNHSSYECYDSICDSMCSSLYSKKCYKSHFNEFFIKKYKKKNNLKEINKMMKLAKILQFRENKRVSLNETMVRLIDELPNRRPISRRQMKTNRINKKKEQAIRKRQNEKGDKENFRGEKVNDRKNNKEGDQSDRNSEEGSESTKDGRRDSKEDSEKETKEDSEKETKQNSEKDTSKDTRKDSTKEYSEKDTRRDSTKEYSGKNSTKEYSGKDSSKDFTKEYSERDTRRDSTKEYSEKDFTKEYSGKDTRKESTKEYSERDTRRDSTKEYSGKNSTKEYSGKDSSKDFTKEYSERDTRRDYSKEYSEKDSTKEYSEKANKSNLKENKKDHLKENSNEGDIYNFTVYTKANFNKNENCNSSNCPQDRHSSVDLNTKKWNSNRLISKYEKTIESFKDLILDKSSDLEKEDKEVNGRGIIERDRQVKEGNCKEKENKEGYGKEKQDKEGNGKEKQDREGNGRGIGERDRQDKEESFNNHNLNTDLSIDFFKLNQIKITNFDEKLKNNLFKDTGRIENILQNNSNYNKSDLMRDTFRDKGTSKEKNNSIPKDNSIDKGTSIEKDTSIDKDNSLFNFEKFIYGVNEIEYESEDLFPKKGIEKEDFGSNKKLLEKEEMVVRDSLNSTENFFISGKKGSKSENSKNETSYIPCKDRKDLDNSTKSPNSNLKHSSQYIPFKEESNLVNLKNILPFNNENLIKGYYKYDYRPVYGFKRNIGDIKSKPRTKDESLNGSTTRIKDEGLNGSKTRTKDDSLNGSTTRIKDEGLNGSKTRTKDEGLNGSKSRTMDESKPRDKSKTRARDEGLKAPKLESHLFGNDPCNINELLNLRLEYAFSEYKDYLKRKNKRYKRKLLERNASLRTESSPSTNLPQRISLKNISLMAAPMSFNKNDSSDEISSEELKRKLARGKGYICAYCDERFYDKPELATHILEKHATHSYKM